jgi:death-on-curing protein
LPSEPKWLRDDIIRAAHDAQIAEHGGIAGVRSEDLLASARARPNMLASFDADADSPAIGAMYAIAIARNHPFLDGNKRVAWIAMRTFLEINGIGLTYDPIDAVRIMLSLAAGEITDELFTQWVRDHAAR